MISWAQKPRPGPLYRIFDINPKTYARVAPFIFLFFSPQPLKIISHNWYQPDPHFQFNIAPTFLYTIG